MRGSVSVGWAALVPLVLWWPLTLLVYVLQKPGPGEPGVDLAGLIWLPALVAWLPMVAVTALVAWLAGRKGPADDRRRRNRGLGYGILTLIIVPGVLLYLESIG